MTELENNDKNLDPGVASQKPELANSEEQNVATFLLVLEQKLRELRLSRRNFLKFLFLGTSAFSIDHYFLQGRGRKYLWDFVSNPEFRNKLFDAISTGELVEEDIPALIQDILGAPNYLAELGDILQLSESWMNQVFENVQVRQLLEGGEDKAHMVMIAPLNKISLITGTAPEQRPQAALTDFSLTEQQIGSTFVIPPGTQKKESIWTLNNADYSQLTPLMYSAYQTENGVIEYFEEDEERRNRGGALILNNQKLIVVPTEQVADFSVGENCQAIEVVAFSVSSATLEADLQAIENTPTLSGVSPNSASYGSFVVTFSKGAELHTYLISIYNHFDEQTNVVSGTKWESGQMFTIRQGSELAQQVASEQNFDSFIMAVPDAGEFSGVIISQSVSDEQLHSMADAGGFTIDERFSNYQPGINHSRKLWEHPFSQPKVPKYFFAAMK